MHMSNAVFKMLRNSVEYPTSKEISQKNNPFTSGKKKNQNKKHTKTNNNNNKVKHVLKMNCSGLCLTKEKSFGSGLFL